MSADANAPCGFLEEAPGEKSSTRLFALMMVCGCLVLILTIAAVAIRSPKDAPGVIASIGGALIPLAGGIWGVVNARR